MATDLDPIFVRALKLLHSRSKDALDQLKQMTDEAIAQRRGELALKKLEDGKIDDIKPLYKFKREYSEVDKKRETEKKSLDKLKDDLASLTDDTVPLKKPKLEQSVSESKLSSWKDRDSSRDRERSKDGSGDRTSHRDLKRDRERDETHNKPTIKEDPSWLDTGRETLSAKVKVKVEDPPPEKRYILGGNKDTDSSDDNEDSGSFPGLDAEQFASDMMDLACVVCNQFDITSGNRLLDCQECHRLYHQECHKPPVDEDVDDPRFVWYCSKCSKNMKKMVKAQKPKSSQGSSGKEREPSVPHKAFKPEPGLQPFKRLEPSKSGTTKDTTSSVSNGGGNRPFTGLASLAASAKSSRDSTKSSPGIQATSKTDNSKGLGFLFKPDAHKITTMSSSGSQKSLPSSSSLEGKSSTKFGSSSGKSSSGTKSFSPGSSSTSSSSKPAGISLLAKVSSSSSSGTPALPKSSSASSLPRSSSTSGSTGTTKMSSLMTADKKVQMMKKKAAARAAEKKALR